jgi:hypothetical protein
MEDTATAVGDNLAAALLTFTSFKDAGIAVWNQLKNAMIQLLGDVINYAEHVFAVRIISAITNSTSGASAAAKAAGAATGAAWGAAVAESAGLALVAYGGYKFYDYFYNNESGDKFTSPGSSTGYDPGENRNAGGGIGSDSGSTDAGVSMPGFASGTRGRYLDFGRGTPVWLHGRERVMTEEEGKGGGTTVIINAIDSQSFRDFLRRGGAMDIVQETPRALTALGLA